MNARYLGIIAFVGALVVPVAAGVAHSDSSAAINRDALINRLQQQERMDEYKAKFWTQEPITQQDYYVQEREDRQLISRLSTGEQVSQDELDLALKRVDTDY
jgi:hypothetical protein